MNHSPKRAADPHAKQPILRAGPSANEAAVTLILLHGRGATAEDILSLYRELQVVSVAALAPQAAGNAWYPSSFLAPLEANQPYLDSALGLLERIVRELLDQEIRSERIALLGFSQGACLTVEYVARHPRHYGAVMGLTGGLMGPPGTLWNYSGSLSGTAVFLGASDPDPHVPFQRVRETERVLSAMGATVLLRRYVGMGHTVNPDELQACRELLQRIGS